MGFLKLPWKFEISVKKDSNVVGIGRIRVTQSTIYAIPGFLMGVLAFQCWWEYFGILVGILAIIWWIPKGLWRGTLRYDENP